MGCLRKGAVIGIPSLLLFTLLLLGGAAQTATVKEASSISCEAGYAFWAQETDRADSYETVLWSGSENDVQGKFRSNGAIHVSGSNNSVSGAVEYGSTFVDGGDDNQFGATIQVSPSSPPVSYDLRDYQPGGAVARQAQAEGRYHLINSKLEVEDQGTRLDGLYYVRGKVEISAGDVHGTFTIVAEGKIEISGSDQDYEPYADGLLFFTEISGEKNFLVSGSDSQMKGIIYAPDVGLEISGSNNTFEGGIYVGEGKLNGSSLDIGFDNTYCPEQTGPTSTPPALTATATATPSLTPTPTNTGTPGSSPTPTSTGTPGPSPTPTATSSPGPPPSQHGFYLPVALRRVYRGPGEPNNNCAQAYELSPGVTHEFLAEDGDDWYYAELSAGGDITVRLANFMPRQGQVALYRGPSCDVLVFLRNNGNTATEKTLTVSDQPPGRYYVYVSNDGPPNDGDLYELLIRVDGP